MYELLKEFIKPEILVLVPVLYLIGMALKQSTSNNKYIPLFLGAIGIVMSFMYLAANVQLTCAQDVIMCVFMGVTQGVLAAGASVYANQIIKQAGKEE